MRKLVHILLLAAALFAVSCERRPLMELSNTHYVRIYLNEEIKNVTTGFYDEDSARPVYRTPDVLRVTLADPESGRVMAERFLRDKGEDERGVFYEGYIIADPGIYSLIAYNFDTETTVINSPHDHSMLSAYTGEIASHLRTKIPSRTTRTPGEEVESIVYDPDHLLVANIPEVYVPYVDYVDTLRTPDGGYFYAESIVKSYYMQVRVKGLQYASSSVGLLTGMSGSAFLGSGSMNPGHHVTVYFEMQPEDSPSAGVRRSSDDEAIIYTTFGTFGKLPDKQSELQITFDFLTVYGEPYSETFDITDLFSTPEAVNQQWLLIDHTIEIPEPPAVSGGGGFKPGVGEWGDVSIDIRI